MSTQLIDIVRDFFGDNYIVILLIAMLPIVELRLAVPVGLAMGFPFLPTFLIAVLGNILPAPFLILFSQGVLRWFARRKRIGKFFQKIIDRAEEKAKKFGNRELLALFLFVCIPLPGTGVWTGSLIAAILQIDWKKAFVAVALGAVGAGILMSLISALFGGIFGFDMQFR